MFDEVYCYAKLPDGRDRRGTCFHTKSFPDPCMCRYRITSAGRLIDSANNDLEPEGYIAFYTVDRDGDNESPGRIPGLREYRARQMERSNLQHHRAFPDFPRADRLPTRFADLALRGAADFLFLPVDL
jgi:hypothetical protein